MKEKKTIFAVSDIHGCASALKRALDEAGFDPNSSAHLLVVLGDLFDRGIENREVLAYLNGIKNKILIRGNHEDILMQPLTTGNVTDHQFVNGTHTTLCEFFPYYHGERMLNILESRSRRTAEMLIDLIESMRDYFETDNYILVHGWITDDAGENDFHYASRAKWQGARWIRWHKRYPHFEIPDGKTIVIGHTPAYYASMFDHTRSDYDCSIFYGNGLIAIDGKCSSTGKVNVLVFEDFVRIPESHTLPATTDEISALARGKARVFITPFTDYVANIRVGDKIRFCDTGGGLSPEFIINRLHLYADAFDLADEISPEEIGIINDGPESVRHHLDARYPDNAHPLLAIVLS